MPEELKTPEAPPAAPPVGALPSGALSTPPAPDSSTLAKAGAFKFSGTGPGGPFNIDGEDFGPLKGRVTVGGRDVIITRWNDTSIKGFVPEDLKTGPVEVTMNDRKITAKL